MPDKNMKKIIFGITDLADVLFYELMAAGENIDAFCVNRQYITDTMHLGRKVVAYEDINDIYDVHELGCYIAVGYNSMNDARKKIYHELKEMEIKVLSFVHSSAVVMAERVGEKGALYLNMQSLALIHRQAYATYSILSRCSATIRLLEILIFLQYRVRWQAM